MNKTNYYHITLALVLTVATALAIPALSRGQTLLETQGATDIGASIDNGPGTPGAGSVVKSIRARIQADITAQNTNVRNNQDIRNTSIEYRMTGMASTSSTTPPMDGSRHEPGTSGFAGHPPFGFGSTTASTTWRMASTTRRTGTSTFPGKDAGFMDNRFGTKNLFQVHKDIFDRQKNSLVAELNQSLANLIQIRGRIAASIATAQTNGHVMTNAVSLLATADLKIAAATSAINALAALNPLPPVTPSATSTIATSTATTTATVDLGKPRKIGDAAIKAVNDAKKALNAVVVAIAHAVGLKVDHDGTIIASTTPAITSTGTASTTP